MHPPRALVLTLFTPEYRSGDYRSPPPLFLLAVVRTLSVWHMVGYSVVQHESGRQLWPHHRHGAGPDLHLEGHPLSIWNGVFGRLLRLPAAHQKRAQRCGAAQHRGSSQEEQRR